MGGAPQGLSLKDSTHSRTQRYKAQAHMLCVVVCVHDCASVSLQDTTHTCAHTHTRARTHTHTHTHTQMVQLTSKRVSDSSVGRSLHGLGGRFCPFTSSYV